MAFLWPHGMQGRGLCEGHFFLWEAMPPFLFFKLSDEVGSGNPCPPGGSQVIEELCCSPALSSQVAWAGIRPQPSCPLTTIGSGQCCGVERAMWQGQVRLLLCWEKHPLPLLCCLQRLSPFSRSRFPLLASCCVPPPPSSQPSASCCQEGRASSALPVFTWHGARHTWFGVNVSSPLVGFVFKGLPLLL